MRRDARPHTYANDAEGNANAILENRASRTAPAVDQSAPSATERDTSSCAAEARRVAKTCAGSWGANVFTSGLVCSAGAHHAKLRHVHARSLLRLIERIPAALTVPRAPAPLTPRYSWNVSSAALSPVIAPAFWVLSADTLTQICQLSAQARLMYMSLAARGGSVHAAPPVWGPIRSGSQI